MSFCAFVFFPELHHMNNWLFYNEEIIPDSTPIFTAGNRGLRFGDGLFETIKVVNEKMPLFDLHMERMNQGMAILDLKLQDHYTPDYISQMILDLCTQNNINGAARVRITIVRGNGTLFTTDDAHASIVIQAEPQANEYLAFNLTGLKIDICPGIQKSCDRLANIKSNNYLTYVMAAQHARQHQLNDSLVLNTHNRICDGTIANVFCIHNNTIYTPPLTEGGVGGVMRRYLLMQLPKAGYNVQEKICTPEDLETATEVFLTNALYGIRWVSEFRNKTYSNQLTARLFKEIVSPINNGLHT